MENKHQIKLHNIKFYNLTPRPIQCVAFNANILKLALARSDASLEIWDVRTAPYMERTIMGRPEESIEAVIWLENELLTAGLTGEISYWDLAKLKVKEKLMVTGRSIWCMDVFDNVIAAGTEEGYLNICEFESDMQSLRYVKILDKQDGRILCCKFNETGTHIVTGSIDLLRVWDVSSGHVVHKLTTGRSESKKETVIWSILVLKDLQIASADSRGRLTFWDGKIGCQLESYQCLKGDALCLAADEKEENIFVSGIEPTICSYALTSMKKDSSEVKKWVRTTSYYSHTHDVKALIVHDSNLISGGVDGHLCLTALSSKFYLQYGPLLPRPSAVVTDSRLILLKYVNYLEIWRLGATSKQPEHNNRHSNEITNGKTVRDKPSKLTEHPIKLLELLSRRKEPLTCASISPNGKWLSYSTASHIALFILRWANPSKPELQPIKPHLDHFSPAAISLFSSTSNHLYLYKPLSEEVSIFELFDDNEEIDFKQNISLKKYTSDLVHLMEISKCEKYLVMGSLCNHVVVFYRHEKKVGGRLLMEWRHHMTLPKYNFPAATLTIHPNETRRLTVLYTNNKLIEYNMEDLEFTFSTSVGEIDRGIRYHMNQQVICDPRLDNRLFVLNEKELFCITKSEGNGSSDVDELNEADIKRKRDDAAPVTNSRNYSRKTVKEANHIVSVDWLGEDELVTVEISPQSYLEQLPPTLKLKKYGCG